MVLGVMIYGCTAHHRLPRQISFKQDFAPILRPTRLCFVSAAFDVVLHHFIAAGPPVHTNSYLSGRAESPEIVSHVEAVRLENGRLVSEKPQ